jgi:hypothetical protein
MSDLFELMKAAPGMTDGEVLAEANSVAKDLSFHNAAEGDCWSRETFARESCAARFKVLYEELERRGIQNRFDRSEYLL